MLGSCCVEVVHSQRGSLQPAAAELRPKDSSQIGGLQPDFVPAATSSQIWKLQPGLNLQLAARNGV